jgi:hypothetical protein
VTSLFPRFTTHLLITEHTPILVTSTPHIHGLLSCPNAALNAQVHSVLLSACSNAIALLAALLSYFHTFSMPIAMHRAHSKSLFCSGPCAPEAPKSSLSQVTTVITERVKSSMHHFSTRHIVNASAAVHSESDQVLARDTMATPRRLPKYIPQLNPRIVEIKDCNIGKALQGWCCT